jgi:hypothetical protein
VTELNSLHICPITLAVDAQSRTFLADWVIKLTQFDFNQKIDQSAFRKAPTNFTIDFQLFNCPIHLGWL